MKPYPFIFLGVCILFTAFALFLFIETNITASLAGSTRSTLPSILPTVPGSTNPDITQATIKSTICNPHWSTKSIRPPSSYTSALKVKELKAYGWQDQSTKDYEEDHLISLELGGNPTDPSNLWPQSYLTRPNARDKDRVENDLHRRVCAGQLTLSAAQKAISGDWTKYIPKQVYGATVSNDPDDQ